MPELTPEQQAQIFKAYKSGQMTPEETAQYENDLRGGVVAIPLGESVVTRELPQSVADAFASGKMDSESMRQLQEDLYHGFIKLPKSSSGLDVMDMPMVDKPEPIKTIEPTMGERVKAVGETGLAAASGALGQMAGTLGGIRQSIEQGTFGTPEGANQAEQYAAQRAQQTTIQPESPLGREYAKNLGELGQALQPLAGLTSELSAISGTPVPKVTEFKISGKAAKIMKTATPTVEDLKSTASGIYNKIDESGTIVKAGPIKQFTNGLVQEINKDFSAKYNPTLNSIIKDLQSNESGVNVSYLDSVRKTLNGLRKSQDANERRLGEMFADKIDDFMTGLDKKDFAAPPGVDAGKLYKDARQLWQRASKADTINEIMQKADLQQTGFENGLRTQFRALLTNPKKRASFTAEELDAMRKIVKGTDLSNTAKLMGRMGFKEGQATNYLGGSIAAAAGYQQGGVLGALSATSIGQVAKAIAQRATFKQANVVEQLVRAGKNGNRIANIYFSNVPKAQWNPADLGALLKTGNVNLDAFRAAAGKIKTVGKKRAYLNALFMAEFFQSRDEK